MLNATAVVLEYHNQSAYNNELPVEIELVHSRNLPGKTKTGGKVAGRAWRKKRHFKVCDHYDFDEMFTHIIHELIHIYMPMPDTNVEKCTSTLTSRLKNDIADIYDTLIEGTYQRAAYIAHTKISYEPKDDDYYDPEQYERIPAMSEYGEKYRRGGWTTWDDAKELSEMIEAGEYDMEAWPDDKELREKGSTKDAHIAVGCAHFPGTEQGRMDCIQEVMDTTGCKRLAVERTNGIPSAVIAKCELTGRDMGVTFELYDKEDFPYE